MPEIEPCTDCPDDIASVDALFAVAADEDAELDAGDPRGTDVTRWGPQLIAPYDRPTGDKRRFAVGALSNRDLPVPVKWQRQDNQGHSTSIIVGTVDQVDPRDDGVWASGILFDPDPEQLPRLAEDVGEVRELSRNGVLGPSVDLDDMEFRALEDSDFVGELAAGQQRPDIEVTKGRISAITLVSIPAFAEVGPLKFSTMPADEYAAMVDAWTSSLTAAVQSNGWGSMPLAKPGTAWDAGAAQQRIKAWAGGDMGKYARAFLWGDPQAKDNLGAYKFPIADVIDGDLKIVPNGVKAAYGVLNGAMGGTSIPASDQARMKTVVAAIRKRYDPDLDGDDDRSPATDTDSDRGNGKPGSFAQDDQDEMSETIVPRKRKKAPRIVNNLGNYAQLTPLIAAALSGDWSNVTEVTALTAAAAGRSATGSLPTKAMFGMPEPAKVTPITLGEPINGLTPVFGHLAGWRTCHTGFAGQCRTAPRSRTNYSYFHTGAVRTEEGETVPVGRVTIGAGHADLSYGVRAAAEHYDNAAATAAYGCARDGKHGIWFSGYVVPGMEDQLLAHPPSGDWRPVGGSLEMIAALAVNSPGFPVPRMAMTASVETGEMEVGALVAAGVVMPATYVPPPGEPVDVAQVAREAARAVLAEQASYARRKRAENLFATIDRAIEDGEQADREAAVSQALGVFASPHGDSWMASLKKRRAATNNSGKE